MSVNLTKGKRTPKGRFTEKLVITWPPSKAFVINLSAKFSRARYFKHSWLRLLSFPSVTSLLSNRSLLLVGTEVVRVMSGVWLMQIWVEHTLSLTLMESTVKNTVTSETS